LELESVRRREFFEKLKLTLQKNSEVRAAWQKARGVGCTEINLIEFLYMYSVGEELVMRPRRENRKRILTQLSALARKLESSATDAEQLLNFRWWKDQPVSELLSGLQVELEAQQVSVIRDGVESLPISGAVRVTGTLRPDFILELPQSLRVASQMLHLCHTGLGKQKGWDERLVGPTLYLADLVLYWLALSGESPAWKDVAALVEGARIASGSSGRSSVETALRLNFENFKKRNPAMFGDIEDSLSEYLKICKPNLSFYSWSLQRQSKGTP
jgi:hypothetical protein